jgi:hypothetical protein
VVEEAAAVEEEAAVEANRRWRWVEAAAALPVAALSREQQGPALPVHQQG